MLCRVYTVQVKGEGNSSYYMMCPFRSAVMAKLGLNLRNDIVYVPIHKLCTIFMQTGCTNLICFSVLILIRGVLKIYGSTTPTIIIIVNVIDVSHT